MSPDDNGVRIEPASLSSLSLTSAPPPSSSSSSSSSSHSPLLLPFPLFTFVLPTFAVFLCWFLPFSVFPPLLQTLSSSLKPTFTSNQLVTRHIDHLQGYFYRGGQQAVY